MSYNIVVVHSIITSSILITPVILSVLDLTLIETVSLLSIYYSVFLLGILFIIPLGSVFSIPLLSLAGSILWFLGMYSTSHVDDYLKLVLGFGILNSFGSSILYISTMHLLFQKGESSRRWIYASILLSFFFTMLLVLYFSTFLTLNNWSVACTTFAWIGGLLLSLASCGLKQPKEIEWMDWKQFKIEFQQVKGTRMYKFLVLCIFSLGWCLFIPFWYLFFNSYAMTFDFLASSKLLLYMSCTMILGYPSALWLAEMIGELNNFKCWILLGTLSMFGWLASTEYLDLSIFAGVYGYIASGIITSSLLLWEWTSVKLYLATMVVALLPGVALSGPVTAVLTSFTSIKVYTVLCFLASFVVSLFIKVN